MERQAHGRQDEWMQESRDSGVDLWESAPKRQDSGNILKDVERVMSLNKSVKRLDHKFMCGL